MVAGECVTRTQALDCAVEALRYPWTLTGSGWSMEMVVLEPKVLRALLREVRQPDPAVAFLRRHLGGRMARTETKPASAPVKKPMVPKTKPVHGPRRPK